MRVNPDVVVRVSLDEVVPLALFGSIKSVELAFSTSSSFSLPQLPRCQGKPFYGALALGNADWRTPVMICEEGGPYLWLDTNGDGELEGGLWHWQGGWQEFGWLFTILVEYIEGDRHYKAPYPVWISAAPDHGREPGGPFYSYFLLPGGYRKGLIGLNGKRGAIAVFDLDIDGRYDDVEDLGVAVDADLDGRICFHCPHEVFLALSPWPEGNRDRIIQIGEKVYTLVRASPSGEWIELLPVKGESPKPPLLPGYPFPELTGKTLWGEDFSLSDLRGKVVLLFFLPHVFCSRSYPSCAAKGAYWAWCSRPFKIAELLTAMSYPNFQMVVVLTEEKPPSPEEWEGLRHQGVIVLWCPWCPKEYRIRAGFLLIDPQGVIRYTDEEVSYSLYGSHDKLSPRMRFEAVFADIFDILWGIERLLEGANLE